MNRTQNRNIMHNLSSIKGLQRKHTKGAFGKTNRSIGSYKSLKVIPLGKRDQTCNQFGVIKYGNQDGIK